MANTLFISSINEPNFYAYPMAASMLGGAFESEFNMRETLNCLISKSFAKGTADFILVDNNGDNLEESDSANWISFNSANHTITIFPKTEILSTKVSPGEGICNGYYLKINKATTISFGDSSGSTANVFQVEVPESGAYIYKFVVALSLTYGVNDNLATGCGIKLIYDTSEPGSIAHERSDINSNKIEQAYANAVSEAKLAGMLDCGIRLGTITVHVNSNFDDSYAQFTNYEYKTSGISLDRFGNETNNIFSDLYKKIKRLFSLMIDNGSLLVGNHYPDFISDSTDSGYDFSKMYKTKIEVRHDTYAVENEDSEDEWADVGIYLVDGREGVLGDYSKGVNDINLLSCKVNVAMEDGSQVLNLKNFSLFNGEITISDDVSNGHRYVDIGNKSIRSHRITLFSVDDIENTNITLKHGYDIGKAYNTADEDIPTHDSATEYAVEFDKSIDMDLNDIVGVRLLDAHEVHFKEIEADKVKGVVWL